MFSVDKRKMKVVCHTLWMAFSLEKIPCNISFGYKNIHTFDHKIPILRLCLLAIKSTEKIYLYYRTIFNALKWKQPKYQ